MPRQSNLETRIRDQINQFEQDKEKNEKQISACRDNIDNCNKWIKLLNDLLNNAPAPLEPKKKVAKNRTPKKKPADEEYEINKTDFDREYKCKCGRRGTARWLPGPPNCGPKPVCPECKDDLTGCEVQV
jgi:chromosome segregation ATPase